MARPLLIFLIMKKIRVLLLAGGQSGEHDVSIKSARSVIKALPTDRFEVTPIVISKAGRWLTNTASLLALDNGSAETGGELVLHQAAIAEGFDVVLPILHGPNGEDGTVQGMLQLAGLPYVGSGVLGSAVCMDKVMTKLVLTSAGIPQVPYVLITRADYAENMNAATTSAAALGFPLFVKPANLGSSVGISKVDDSAALPEALAEAFKHDRRVIVEAGCGKTGHGGKPREIEVGILGNDQPKASPVGELTFNSAFYDYETKYTPGMAQMHIPANIPGEVAERTRSLALAAFKALDCAGLARVDFFYVEATGELYLNEVNTIPGFTATSMYPELWRAGGIEYGELVTRLIELALEKR